VIDVGGVLILTVAWGCAWRRKKGEKAMLKWKGAKIYITYHLNALIADKDLHIRWVAIGVWWCRGCGFRLKADIQTLARKKLWN
jgi:hypothetical protein